MRLPPRFSPLRGPLVGFFGANADEAWHYHDAHRKSDAFLRECEDKCVFAGNVRCRTVIAHEGWTELEV